MYAFKALRAAEEAGADCLVLCDTNGGTLPFDVERITAEVARKTGAKLGIHAHNDSGTAVANSSFAVRQGATQVQGTMNGFGERCGNADLSSIIPSLKFKMKIDCLPDANIKAQGDSRDFLYEIANLSQNKRQPYVGDSAFAHKGGVHVSAVVKSPAHLRAHNSGACRQPSKGFGLRPFRQV